MYGMDTRRDLALALAVAVLGLVIFVMTSSIRTGITRDVIGPRALPYAIGILLMLGGLVLSVLRMLKMNAQSGFQAPMEGTEDSPDHPASAARVAYIMAISVGYAALLMPAGYLIATPPFLALLFLAAGERERHYTFLIPLVWTIATYLLFSQLLDVRLPVGPFAPLFRDLGLIIL